MGRNSTSWPVMAKDQFIASSDRRPTTSAAASAYIHEIHMLRPKQNRASHDSLCNASSSGLECCRQDAYFTEVAQETRPRSDHPERTNKPGGNENGGAHWRTGRFALLNRQNDHASAI